ncbi:MAG: general secretion pathway protein GspB [Woeseiaceae bacterium]
MHRTILTLAALMLTASGDFAAAEESLRDPTRPYSPVQGLRASAPRFVVNAIIISPERRVAIVNGRRVAVGSSIGGATIVAIKKNELVLEIGGKRITAGLNEGAMR